MADTKVFNITEFTSKSLIISCPHSGRFFPNAEDLSSRITVSLNELDRRSDTFTELLALGSGLGRVIYSNIAPTYVNLGRLPTSIDPADFRKIDETKFSCEIDKQARNGQGVISSKFFMTGQRIYRPDKEPDQSEISDRLNNYYYPYHGALESAVHEILFSSGRATVLDLHSYSDLRLVNGRIARVAGLPDISIGILKTPLERSVPICVAESLAGLAAKFGYRAKINFPYSGGYITKKFGNNSNSTACSTIRICFFSALIYCWGSIHDHGLRLLPTVHYSIFFDYFENKSPT